MFFSFDNRDWIPLEDGRLLIGSENGLGSIRGADGESLGAGELKDGVLHGYGFAFVRTVKEYTETRKRTYEEVMETAEFDSCGRPIHYESGPITVRKRKVDWISMGTGLWEEGRLVKPAAMSFPKDLVLEVTWEEYMSNRLHRDYMPDDLVLVKANPEGYIARGWASACVQPLPDGRVLVVEEHGAVYVLAPGDVVRFDHAKNPTCYNSFIYKLKYGSDDLD